MEFPSGCRNPIRSPPTAPLAPVIMVFNSRFLKKPSQSNGSIFWVAALLQPLLVISQQLDPIQNLCSRWDQQSALLNRTIYIDGGVEIFVSKSSNGTLLPGTQSVGINKNLISLDMTSKWSWRYSMPFHIEDSNQTSTKPPTLIDGALWPYKNFLYLYGGKTSRLNDSFVEYSAPTTDEIVMWKYDTGEAKWDVVGLPSENGKNFPRLSSGASTVAPDQGLAFHLGGEIDNGTSADTENDAGVTYANRFFLFNFTTESTRNLSTDALGHNGTRVNSEMLYIPEVGGKGILVLLGGGYDSDGQLFPMDQIFIFDIASIGAGGGGTWYNQTATGDIPSPRIGFCIVVASAPDKSSYNIFLYGGWNGVGYFDDVYILSIPSFRWIKIYQGTDKRIGHTCHVVGNRQLLTIGGRRVDKLPGECDWEPNAIALYDMVALDWIGTYSPSAAEWEVPKDVTAVIGGNAMGNASAMAPSVWADGLEKLFVTKSNSTVAVPTTTSQSPQAILNPPAHKKLSKSAIVGLAIGLTSFCVLLILIITHLYRVHAAKSNTISQSPLPLAELRDTASLAASQELLGSLGRPGMGNKVVELEADTPKYTSVRGSNGNPFELPEAGEYDRNNLKERPVSDRPQGNRI